MPTKLEKMLMERGWSQGALIRAIEKKSGFRIGRDRISKITTGRLKDYHIQTACMIAQALDCTLDELVEDGIIRKRNKKSLKKKTKKKKPRKNARKKRIFGKKKRTTKKQVAPPPPAQVNNE